MRNTGDEPACHKRAVPGAVGLSVSHLRGLFLHLLLMPTCSPKTRASCQRQADQHAMQVLGAWSLLLAQWCCADSASARLSHNTQGQPHRQSSRPSSSHVRKAERNGGISFSDTPYLTPYSQTMSTSRCVSKNDTWPVFRLPRARLR